MHSPRHHLYPSCGRRLKHSVKILKLYRELIACNSESGFSIAHKIVHWGGCCLCLRVSTHRRTGPAISGTPSATVSQPHGLAQPRSKTILYCAYSLISYCLASLPFRRCNEHCSWVSIRPRKCAAHRKLITASRYRRYTMTRHSIAAYTIQIP